MYNIFLFQPRKLPLGETVTHHMTSSASCSSTDEDKTGCGQCQDPGFGVHLWLGLRRPCAVGGPFMPSNVSEANSSREFCGTLQSYKAEGVREARPGRGAVETYRHNVADTKNR